MIEQELAESSSGSLTFLAWNNNKMWGDGKGASAVLVFKRVKHNTQGNCQPASLKSALSNTMEKMTHRSIIWELKERSIEVRSNQWDLCRTTPVKVVYFHNLIEITYMHTDSLRAHAIQ